MATACNSMVHQGKEESRPRSPTGHEHSYCRILAAASSDWTDMAVKTVSRISDRVSFTSCFWKFLTLLFRYFLLGDSLNTTVTVIATLQNSIVAYNTLQLTYLLIVGIAAQAIGIYAFWQIQKRYQLSTKTMFNIIAVAIIVLDVWGMIGIWTQSFGFHHVWEVWLYQAYYGLFVCPWYSYSQIMISEVTPRGREFLFFSLFSIIGKTSSFIGPLVSSAIIDASPTG